MLYWSFSIAAILIFILPFFYIIKYTHFAADDFCRVPADFDHYFENVAYWYMNITGRYTNGFISYLPLYNLEINRLVLKILIVGLGLISYLFINKSFDYFKIAISKTKCLLISVLFFIALISQLPSVYEFFYWYAASTVYLISIIFFLLFLIMIFNLNYKNPYQIFIICLLVILLNGNNEMLIPITNLILFGFLLEKIIFHEEINLKYLLINVISWFSSLIVILAPGNSNRQTYYAEGGDLLHSLKSSVLSSGMFTLKSLIEFPYFLLYIGLFLFIFDETRNQRIKTYKCIHPILLFGISIILLASVIAVPYYATGYVKINDGRIGNMIHIIFLILLFINLLNSTIFFNKRMVFKKVKFFKKISIGLFIFFFLLVPFTNQNYLDLYSDFKNGSFAKYDLDIEKREEKLRVSDLGEIRIIRIKGSRTIKHLEITKNPKEWENQCYTAFINKKYNLNIRSITVE
ncbi:DUF6056 domain-containing protein [Gillisia hiemivivida]